MKWFPGPGRIPIGLVVAATVSIVVALGAIQVASMSAYGDLATRPSLPALLNAAAAGSPRVDAGATVEHAAALAHDKQFAAAERMLATLPENPQTDDLHGDIATARGDTAGALRWYLRAGDASRAQHIIDTAYARDPQRGLAAQLELVHMLQRRTVSSDLLADAWWKLGERQRAISDARGDGRGSSDALRSFERALVEAPNRKSYLLAGGVEALKLGDTDEAARLLTHAVEVGPSNANAYGVLALVYAAQKNCGLARTELDAWRAHSVPDTRPPDRDPQFGAALRTCLTPASSAGTETAPAHAPGSIPAGHPTPPATQAPKGPRILSVAVSPMTVHSFSSVTGAVKTSLDVVSMQFGVVGVPPINVPKLGPGSFGGSITLPFLPSFVHGTYAVTFTAYDDAGRTTSAVVGVAVP